MRLLVVRFKSQFKKRHNTPGHIIIDNNQYNKNYTGAAGGGAGTRWLEW
jgi:hypothetical protein